MNSSLNLLKIKNALVTEQINHVAFHPNSTSQILAAVLSNNDVVVWTATIESADQIIKWIPWREDENTRIQAVTFRPTSVGSILDNNKIELLVLTANGSIYTMSIDKIINGQNPHQRYSQSSLYPSCPLTKFTPTSIVWWESSHVRHKNIAIIGGTNGEIVFYSLSHSHYLTCMNIGSKSAIFSLSICSDFFRDFSYLLITDDLRQQWKLLLEKEVNDDHVVLIVFEEYEPPQDEKEDNELVLRSHKSRLQEFKQISVETFALFKQKLNESRKTTYDKPKSGSTSVEPSELQPCECYGEAFLSVQQYRSRKILSGFSIPESILEVYMQNGDTVTLIHHKFQVSPLVTTLLLTHTFIYVADIFENQHRILVFSTRLSKFEKSETVEYNPSSFVQSFLFPDDEHIISLFKMEVKLPAEEKLDIQNLSMTGESLPSNQPPMHTRIKQIRLEDEWNEACLVVTNKCVYIISLRNNPVKLASEYIKTDASLLKRLPNIFNISLSKIIELIADRLIEEKNAEDALVLCNRFQYYSGKITLRLASFGYIEELLLYTENLLNQIDLDLPLVERIYLSNFVVTCYIERYLRDPCNENFKQQFLRFLKTSRFYNEEVNIHILASYRLCEFVYFLIVSRGLYVDGMVALTNMIASGLNDEFKNLIYYDKFWLLFGDTSLVDSFVLNPPSVHLHIYFLREYISNIPPHVLRKLYHFYDPLQPVLRPAMCRMLSSPIDKYLELYDFENDKWGSDANMFDWITNFIFLHIHLYKDSVFDPSLAQYVSKSLSTLSSSSEVEITSSETHNSLSVPVLCAGFAHAALVRNGSLVMWGQSAYGCLGVGPTLSQNCAPALNSWFEDHRIRVKYIACGKDHTLAVTENGVYAWGFNKFGQLGIGTVAQSAYPRLIETLSASMIVNISAGQYHSLAVDSRGRLWTWGWGVYGQLGHSDVDDQYYPKCVESFRKKFITQACGGQAHSVVLTEGGKIYTFGCNTYGQLGIGTTVKCATPVKVFGIQENIVMVATNYFHNLALSDSNRLYTWGASPHTLKLRSQSQRRARSMHNVVDKPNEMTIHENTPKSNLEAIDLQVMKKTLENGTVEYPSIHTNNRHLSPTLVDTSLVEGNIKQISCGLFHSALLTTCSQIYTWGRNMDGQLGNRKRHSDILLPTLVNVFPVKFMSSKQQMEVLSRPLWSVSCGRDYTIVVELESRLFGWGNNSCGQLGSPPQDDYSIKRFLNGKFIVNKCTKRMIKSHGSMNIIEKPIEIINLPKFPLLFNTGGYLPDRYIQLERNLDLPGESQSRYLIPTTHFISSRLSSGNKILHYYLECFHRYYNVDYILQICSENNNLQAVSKVCVLNYRFFDAFFYGLKALLSCVRENYYFNSFKETCYEDLSKKRLIPKKVNREVENPEGARICVNFEFVEDVVCEAVSMFEKYYKMVLQFTVDKLSSFLKQCISVWIQWEIPMRPLENLLSQYLGDVAYPLTVFLFCDRCKMKMPTNDLAINISSNVENNAWREEQLCLPAYLHSHSQPLSIKITKYPFISNNKTKINNYNLYGGKNDWCLESTKLEYQLTPDEILQQLSVQFTLQLCDVVTESMSQKSFDDFEEFIHLLHQVIFSPSLLKTDDRSSHEILSAVLSNLKRNQAPRKFMQISYEELMNKSIENKFVVFSCGHYYTSQSDFEKEVNHVVSELDRLRLLSSSKLVNRVFSDTSFTSCCANCLFQFIQKETIH